MKTNSVSSENFIVAWQQSKTVGEVALKLGMKEAAIYARVSYLRKRGVPLKRFHLVRRNIAKWKKLKELAIASK